MQGKLKHCHPKTALLPLDSGENPALHARGSFNTFALILGLLLVATVLKSICMFIQEVLVGRAVQLVTMDVRKALLPAFAPSDYQTLTKQGTSDLMALFTHDIDTLANGLTLLAGKSYANP